MCPNPFSCSNSIPRVLNIKSGFKDTNPFIPSPQMKLIWVLPENRGQNDNFRPNRVKPRVHRSTGDRGVHHHRSAGGVHSGRPVRSAGGLNKVRSTDAVDRWTFPVRENSRKSVQKPANPVPIHKISRDNH